MSDVASGGWSRTPEAARRYNMYSSLVLVAISAFLLIISFMLRSPVPLPVRGAIVIFLAVSALAAAGRLPIRNPQDFFGGMALILLALIAFIASNELPGMRGFAFGPGTAPRLFAGTLIALAVGVVAIGLMTKGPHITPYRLRGLIFIIGAILAFAATIRPLGLVVASFSTIVICAAATEDVKWRETVIWAAVLTAFVSILFPYGLALPFQLWPRFY